MSTVERRRSPVYRQLEAYKESWQSDLDALQECWSCEDTIAVRLATYSLVERVDQAWRDRVFRGIEDYSEVANEFYRTLHELGLRITEEVLVWATQMQGSSGAIAGTGELREAGQGVCDRLSQWQVPKLASAGGLRDMTLTPEAARELDRLIDQTEKDSAADAQPGAGNQGAGFPAEVILLCEGRQACPVP